MIKQETLISWIERTRDPRTGKVVGSSFLKEVYGNLIKRKYGQPELKIFKEEILNLLSEKHKREIEDE